jgi:hypothetical protein
MNIFFVTFRLCLKCDGARSETRFRLSAKRTSPFKSAGASVQSTIGSRGVRISGSNAGYTMFRGSVKSTGYRIHSPVSPSFPLPCVTVCHHISTGFFLSRAKHNTILTELWSLKIRIQSHHIIRKSSNLSYTHSVAKQTQLVRKYLTQTLLACS